MTDRPAYAYGHAHTISDASSTELDRPLNPSTNNYGAAPDYYAGGSTGDNSRNPDAFKVSDRNITRTPSPSPSELDAMKDEKFDWSRLRTKEFWFRKKVLIRVIIAVVAIVFIVLFDHYKTQIVQKLKPVADHLKSMNGGFLIPVAIFVVISFPPLFGHELLALILGASFGFWEGFGITALGTLLGEIANFFVFKYFCTSRARKFEQKNISYAVTATILREGGFWVALLARYSFIPGHILTAIFSTCGTNFFLYLIACVLSLPKHASIVLVGTIILEEADNTESTKDKIANYVVIALTSIVSIYAWRFMKRKTAEIKPRVIYNRRKARQEKMAREIGVTLPAPSASNLSANPSLEDGQAYELRAPSPQRVPASQQPYDPYAQSQASYPYNPPAYPAYAPPAGPPPRGY